jgi:hypothetical protein
MGVLYNSVKLQQKMKREFVLDHLKKMGVTHSEEGKSIDELSYRDLKYELVLAVFRKIDVEKEENKWF